MRTIFGSVEGETLRQAMGTEDRTHQAPPAAHPAAHLVFGGDSTIASTVYGTVTAMATVAAYGRAFPDDPWQLVLLVVSTALVLWAAHLYAHGLSESLSERGRLRSDILRTLAHRELGILLAAGPPAAALLLGAVGAITERASIWLALGVGLAVLGVEGARYARIERLGPTGTLVAVAANLGLGLLVVALKVAILH